MKRVLFDSKIMVEKYGSWIRVQVAFWGFIFNEGIMMSDDDLMLEPTLKAIEGKWDSFKEAWESFVISVFKKEEEK